MRLKLVYIYSFVVTLLYLLTACTDGIEASSDSNGQGEGKEIPVSIMPKLVAGDENEVSQLRVIIFSTRTSNPYGPKVLVSNQLIDLNEDYVAITYIGYNDIYVIGNEPVDLSGINSPEELKNIQMNTESIVGGLFDRHAAYCRKLLMNGYVHFLGSDCHGANRRKPLMKDAIEKLKLEFVNSSLAEKILFENPIKMLEGKYI